MSAKTNKVWLISVSLIVFAVIVLNNLVRGDWGDLTGGFGNLKGKVFRVGCMGEVNRYHVMRTISSISSTLAMMGYETDTQAGLKVAEEKLKTL